MSEHPQEGNGVAAEPVAPVRFGTIPRGQQFLRKGRPWTRTRGCWAIRTDLIGTGQTAWPMDVNEMVVPIAGQ